MCIPIWSLGKLLRNHIRSPDSRFLATGQVVTSKAVHQTQFRRKYDEVLKGLAKQDYTTDQLPAKESTHTYLFRMRNVIICVMLTELEDGITLHRITQVDKCHSHFPVVRNTSHC